MLRGIGGGGSKSYFRREGHEHAFNAHAGYEACWPTKMFILA